MAAGLAERRVDYAQALATVAEVAARRLPGDPAFGERRAVRASRIAFKDFLRLGTGLPAPELARPAGIRVAWRDTAFAIHVRRTMDGASGGQPA